MKRLVLMVVLVLIVLIPWNAAGQPTQKDGPLYWDPPSSGPGNSEENGIKMGEGKEDFITPMKSQAISIDDALKRRLKILHRPTRNLILVIVEGLDASVLKFSRDLLTDKKSLLEIDQLPITGRAIAHAADSRVCDAAAAATTLATGKIGLLNRIAVDVSAQPQESLLSAARAQGWKVGLVTDSPLTDAVPLAFLAHGQPEIDAPGFPKQVVDSGVHVIMGGGRRFFVATPSVNLMKHAEQNGFLVVQDKQTLIDGTSQKPQKMFGIFADLSLPASWEADWGTAPRCAEMAAAALNILRLGEKGLVCVVHHGGIRAAKACGDLARLAEEMRAFEETMKVLTDFAQFNQDTLLVTVALPNGPEFALTPEFSGGTFSAIASSTALLVERWRKLPGSGTALLAETFPALRFSEEETRALETALPAEDGATQLGMLVAQKLGVVFGPTPVTSHPAGVPDWFGEDILIHSMGAHQSLFGGVLHLGDIPKRMAATLGWTFP